MGKTILIDQEFNTNEITTRQGIDIGEPYGFKTHNLMDKICNYKKVGTLDVIIPHEIAEILIKNLVKVMFRTTSPITIYMISIKLYL